MQSPLTPTKGLAEKGVYQNHQQHRPGEGPQEMPMLGGDFAPQLLLAKLQPATGAIQGHAPLLLYPHEATLKLLKASSKAITLKRKLVNALHGLLQLLAIPTEFPAQASKLTLLLCKLILKSFHPLLAPLEAEGEGVARLRLGGSGKCQYS
ncbi:MAG: hypothetical protein CSA07_03580 [Bacteroidia bacterium]|nr:MAG: hypothetical protein CSA07_03580 [Bacteroidia bacterium]